MKLLCLNRGYNYDFNYHLIKLRKLFAWFGGFRDGLQCKDGRGQ